jgi:hypothetical protein
VGYTEKAIRNCTNDGYLFLCTAGVIFRFYGFSPLFFGENNWKLGCQQKKPVTITVKNSVEQQVIAATITFFVVLGLNITFCNGNPTWCTVYTFLYFVNTNRNVIVFDNPSVTVEMVTLCVGRIPSCQKRLLFINAQ